MASALAAHVRFPASGVSKTPDVRSRISIHPQHKTTSNMRQRSSRRANHVPPNTHDTSAQPSTPLGMFECLMYGITALHQRADSLERNAERQRDDLNARIDGLAENTDKRFDSVDKRIDELKRDTCKRFDGVDKRVDELKRDTDKRFDAMDKRFDRLEDKVSGLSHKVYAASVLAAVLSSIGVASLTNLDKFVALANTTAHQSAH
jgi:hypothetical protein